jgi:hypothetical protein
MNSPRSVMEVEASVPMSFPRDQKAHRISSTLLLGTLLLCLAACNATKSPSSTAAQPESRNSASAAPASDSGLPDVCKLLTKEEAETILGEAVREPEPAGIGGNKICDYKTVRVHGGILPYSIHIAIIPEKPQTWDIGKKLQLEAKELRPVTGLGDDAYFLLDDLEILSKQRSVTINVLKSIDKPDHAKAVDEAEKIVAQKALSRM